MPINSACCLPNRSGLYFWLCKSMGSQQQLVFEFGCKLNQCTVSSKKYQCTVIYKCISGWILWCPISMLISLNSSHRNIFASFILKLNQPCLLLLALWFPAKVWTLLYLSCIFTFCFFIIISVLFGGYNLLFWPSGFFVHYILGLCMCSFFFFFGSQKFIFCWLRNVFFSPCFFQCIRIIIGGVDFVHVYLKLPLRGRQGSHWW